METNSTETSPCDSEYYELPIVYLSRSGCKDDGSAPGLGHTVLTGLQDPERALEYKICQ